MISAQRLVRVVPTITRANDKFRRYGPIDKHEVRKADITGQSYFEQVKRARQMLREMTPGQALEVIEFHRDLTVFEALALAQKEGRLIIPNDIHDGILTKIDDRTFINQNYPVWTGTFVIYEAPDKKLGKNVIFSWKDNKVEYSISFEVPKKFRGKSNCALVVEHPDFDLIDLGNNKYELKITDEKVHQIQDFPKSDGWYMPNAETGIPHGEAVKGSSDSRYLWRLEDSSYLGPVARVSYGRDVYLYYWPSNGLGVALVSLAVAPKKSDSHD